MEHQFRLYSDREKLEYYQGLLKKKNVSSLDRMMYLRRIESLKRDLSGHYHGYVLPMKVRCENEE